MTMGKGGGMPGQPGKVLSSAQLLHLHNDWRGMSMTLDMDPAPVQLDAALGYVNAVQEMLVYASEDLLKLLPALPERLKKGRIQGFSVSEWKHFHVLGSGKPPFSGLA